ncbi:hypothetical protein SLEP1_g45299 [Rubroshorea leprosula]|uniref:Uncharacterized protein n=1 Tax=Rubroshorea leprosula TaxID=152421 RepID=A0AAV5LJC7_9ROSI|nr:hypothetical protein SLEP1_g45299 [Rubroshorea leprosula]
MFVDSGRVHGILAYHIFRKRRLYEVWLLKCNGPIYRFSNM